MELLLCQFSCRYTQLFNDYDPCTPLDSTLIRSNIFFPVNIRSRCVSTKHLSQVVEISKSSQSQALQIFCSPKILHQPRKNSAHTADVPTHACLFFPNAIDRFLSFRHSEYFLHVKRKNHGSEKYSRNVNLRSHMCSEVTKTASEYLAKMMRCRSHEKRKLTHVSK